jgi:anti-sigma regulatory factor (Ser/Thr protein kinase)
MNALFGTEGDVVDLVIPVGADLEVLARLSAATVAGRAGFGLEDIEDLRLAVEELCLSVVPTGGTGRLHLCYSAEGDTLKVTCTFEGDPSRNGIGPHNEESELAERILDALVDQHGHDQVDGRPCAWLMKRRVVVASDD